MAYQAIINAQITYINQSARLAQAMGILEQWVESLNNPSEN